MRCHISMRSGRRVKWPALLLLALTALLLPPSSAHAADSAEAPTPASAAEAPFSRETVVDTARQLSTKSFEKPPQVPEFLRNLSYEAWEDILFKPEKALWHDEGLPFQLQFFHPGHYYDTPVTINIVENGTPSRLPFDVSDFDYGRNDLAERISPDMGYAGFRIHGPINTPKRYDEIAVFLGASYFRAVAKGQVYGLSARGLAVDTALRNGEEFPYFREYWIEKPGSKSKDLIVHALLDSESLTGAYTFTIHGGATTTMNVKSTLFLRKPVEKIGIAPLTSMFLYGENTSPRTIDNFRPEVHNSDGMLMATASGEWLWRPLSNPKTLQVDTFEAADPVGFGLLQRDRDFHSYEDLNAHYESRPSLWVTPKGRWGEGRVELVLIPTDKEIHDNIAAYWVPKEPIQPGVPASYEYSMSWDAGTDQRPPAGYVTATRTEGQGSKGRRFVVDFEGKALALLPAQTKVIGVVTTGPGATVEKLNVTKNDVTGGWRLSFVVKADEASPMELVLPDKRSPVDLRAFLRVNDNVLTETWNYAFKP